jgi:hypothetical protein
MRIIVTVILVLAFLVLAFAILTGDALAADYSQYTTEELENMRGTMQDASREEREAFRTEWQKRVQNMTPDERQKYMGRPDKSESQWGKGMMKSRGGYGKGMGRGSGRGSGGGMGGGRR